jgi:hypothetical protein
MASVVALYYTERVGAGSANQCKAIIAVSESVRFM